MSTRNIGTSTSAVGASSAAAPLKDPGFQAFTALRVVFTVAPILFGLDKFAKVLTDWTIYLAPWIDGLLPGTAQQGMYAVGVIEIIAGIAVAVAPRYGALLVAAWLAGIIINLLTLSGFYDVALRDFGLFVAAITLWRLALAYNRPRTVTTSSR